MFCDMAGNFVTFRRPADRAEVPQRSDPSLRLRSQKWCARVRPEWCRPHVGPVRGQITHGHTACASAEAQTDGRGEGIRRQMLLRILGDDAHESGAAISLR